MRKQRIKNKVQEHDELTLSVLQRYHHISNVTESLVKDSQLDRVAELIDQVDRVYFFGIGSSGLVAREMKLRFMRLGVVCGALTDQDGFAWTTSILDSSCLVIGFSLSGGTNSITDSLLDAKEKGAKTVLVTANPAAIHQGFTEVLPAAPLPSSTYIDRNFCYFTTPHCGRFDLWLISLIKAENKRKLSLIATGKIID